MEGQKMLIDERCGIEEMGMLLASLLSVIWRLFLISLAAIGGR